MNNQLPEFVSCPVCRRVLPKMQVTHDAIVDGSPVKICDDCSYRSGFPPRLEEYVEAGLATTTAGRPDRIILEGCKHF